MSCFYPTEKVDEPSLTTSRRAFSNPQIYSFSWTVSNADIISSFEKALKGSRFSLIVPWNIKGDCGITEID